MKELPKKSLLISVGGTPEPIVCSINQLDPDKIIFFTSSDTRRIVVEEVLPKLPKSIDHEIIVATDPQNISECVKILLEEVPRAMKNMGLPNVYPDIVDFTGGTKVMSAAVVWCSSRYPCQFNYIGAEQNGRTKEGVGIVISGKEKTYNLPNPWNEAVYYEIQDVFKLINVAQYANAAELLEKMENKVSDEAMKDIIHNLRFVVKGLHHWDIFDFKQAKQDFAKHLEALVKLLKQRVNFPVLPKLLQFAEEIKKQQERLEKLCNAISGDYDFVIVWDLIANAKRRAYQEKKYEDAVARLYSAIEKYAKIILKKKFEIDNSKADSEKIPEKIREKFLEKYSVQKDGKTFLRFGLEGSYELLNVFGDHAGQTYDWYKEDIRSALEARNNSILAHGTRTVGKEDWEKLYQVALKIFKNVEGEIVQFPVYDFEG